MTPQKRSNITVVILLFLLTTPLLVLGLFVKYQVLPGLPLSSLSFCLPAISMIIFLVASNRPQEIIEHVKFLFGVPRPTPAPALVLSLILMPLILVASFLGDQFLGRQVSVAAVDYGKIPFLFLIFLISAFGEELLWTGYFLRQFKDGFRWKWALSLASAYVLWHAGLFLQTGNDGIWILGQMSFSFLFRLLMVEFYHVAGKSGIGILFLHATYNLAWQMYPNNGSYYDPVVTSLVTLVCVLCFELIRRTKVRRTRV